MPPERGPSVNRRQFLAAAAGVATVAGFDVTHRRWVALAEAADATFDRVPPLDGRLLTDPAARAADATDQGNTVFVTPAAVLQPGASSGASRASASITRWMLGERHLRRVLTEYVAHFKRGRPDQGIGQRTPRAAHSTASPQRRRATESVIAVLVLGGLHDDHRPAA